MADTSSSFRGPCFCRHMNKADEFIMCLPDDAASKLWGVYKCPTNVVIHTDDGRQFNVGLSAAKGKIFFFHGWSNDGRQFNVGYIIILRINIKISSLTLTVT
ncbi:putative DNA-binding pseudobarrel domain superfamily [Helianthus annuus]|nr:putative DNA-binding pseudobarrel domain superfamily [Helianthus annuus]